MKNRLPKPLSCITPAPIKRAIRGRLSRQRRADGHETRKPPSLTTICGYPRSGSSLFYNMLSVSLSGQRFFSREVPYRTVIESCDEGNAIVTKRPLDLLELDKIASRNRNACGVLVLLITRDLRDVITSHHENVPGDYFIGYDASYHVSVNEDGGYVSEKRGPGIERLSECYKAALSLHEGFDVEVVSYEKLVRSPAKTQIYLEGMGLEFAKPLEKWFDLGAEIAFRRASGDMSGALYDKALQQDRVGRWRHPEHVARIRSQFDSHPELFELLRYHGYEESNDWYDHLCDGSARKSLRDPRPM